jgi:hypothetical protein
MKIRIRDEERKIAAMALHHGLFSSGPTSTIPFSIRTLNTGSGSVAGPWRTAPDAQSNRAPCQAH